MPRATKEGHVAKLETGPGRPAKNTWSACFGPGMEKEATKENESAIGGCHKTGGRRDPSPSH